MNLNVPIPGSVSAPKGNWGCKKGKKDYYYYKISSSKPSPYIKVHIQMVKENVYS